MCIVWQIAFALSIVGRATAQFEADGDTDQRALATLLAPQHHHNLTLQSLLAPYALLAGVSTFLCI